LLIFMHADSGRKVYSLTEVDTHSKEEIVLIFPKILIRNFYNILIIIIYVIVSVLQATNCLEVPPELCEARETRGGYDDEDDFSNEGEPGETHQTNPKFKSFLQPWGGYTG
jgi:hypothetical protein